MIKIDLITGFLGSGKTTFLKLWARYLMKKGLRVGILENDYGAVNIDMLLLSGLEGENCGLEMVSGGCCADCHRRRFKTKLIALGMSGYDRVVIEPSGIFDVDEFFDALCESPLDKWYERGSVITVVDADLEENLSEASEYLLASQAAGAGAVVFSKTQNVRPDKLRSSIDRLNRAMEKAGCKRRFAESDVLLKSWDELDDADFERLLDCGSFAADFVKRRDCFEAYHTVYFIDTKTDKEALCRAVEAMMNDNGCGDIFRVKGFVSDNGGWLELNATRAGITLCPAENGQDVVIVIGEGLDENKIKEKLKGTSNAPLPPISAAPN